MNLEMDHGVAPSTLDRNLIAGWLGMGMGVLSGGLIGLAFHRDDFLGGYDSFSRRLVRLGHISFFGLGILNVLYGLTLAGTPPLRDRDPSSSSLIVGAVTMPAVCFLTAWHKPMRHLFVLPVAAVLVGVLGASRSALGRRQ